ncbi:MAG: protein kinase domain-containing protein [Gemmatimonadaceae bacterium]
MPDRIEQAQRAFTAYTVERELGSGGMATVYLAHDRKHDRKVAIKILHADLAAILGSDRFLQEIRVTANLQHPHILGLIDSGLIGDDGGVLRGRPYYVMPYLDGESLRQRLDNEQQLPIADAVRLATEVAGALDYAHRHSVVHRDIKPENILLHDGSAIVADFGISLALTQAGGARMTQSGISLGTPTYMSPEQASGERSVTPRSDIYSLGAVTYEMLSGEPPFGGANAQAVIAKVMTQEPRPLTSQRRSVPLHVASAVSRALEKVPADRFASAHEFAEALNNPSSVTASTPRREAVATDRTKWMLYGAASLAGLFLGISIWALARPASPRAVVRYSIAFDSAEALAPDAPYWGRLDISRDGSRLAYLGGPLGQIFIRPRNQLHATALNGTEGALTPFFSPDGNQVGFSTIRTVFDLHIVSVAGGPPVLVTDSLVSVAGASWGADGYIYIDSRGPLPLSRVEARQGATPKLFTTLDTAAGEIDHTWPDVLPNGQGVLFTDTFGAKSGHRDRSIFSIAVAEIPSGKHRVIVNDGMYARYAASGHLLYVTANKTLMIVPFDQNTMKLTGTPTSLIQGVRMGAYGSADVVVSLDGTLVYATGAEQTKRDLVWVARDGSQNSIDPDWQAGFMYPALSPDGKELAVTVRPSGQTSDIWIKHLDRGPASRLTLDGLDHYGPAWTADGKLVTYVSNAAGFFDLWTKHADGSAQPVIQLATKQDWFNPRWSPDGRWLLFNTGIGDRNLGDIFGIRPGIDTIPLTIVSTGFTDQSPDVSPNGNWLAYQSNETGRFEIYVVPFPNTRAAKWAISTRGGTEARWAHSGRELFYRDGKGNLVAVEVETNPAFAVGRSVPLFSTSGFSSDFDPSYAVSPDDRRFLMIRPLTAGGFDKLIVVDNWFEELKGRLRK